MSSLYKQLGFSNPDKQIRLLRLEPSPTGTDEYAFSMGVYDFQEDTRPSFVAISYTWGATVPLLPVVINGFRMRVRFNCWYALWQMRHHEGASDASFWIDSLCINQDDDEEKGHQVAMMGEIFSYASSVAASLGTGESLGNVREILASEDNSEIIKLRSRFDQLPYFDRVWVKQEIILAKDISIFYGLERLSWGQFDEAVNARNLQNDNSDLFSWGQFSQAVNATNTNAWNFQKDISDSVSIQLCNHRSQVTKTSTLMDLVVKYETAKASVAADKIYALLSLLPQTDPIRRNLPVIYGEAERPTLFRTLARLLYSHYHDQDVVVKHSLLSMVRDWLGICGLDESVITFLEFQAYYPLDARSFHQESSTFKIRCLHVLKDNNSQELESKELRIDMHQHEPYIVRQYLWFGELHIPPQLKSLRTVYNFSDDPERYGSSAQRGQSSVRRERFFVNSDVRPGDLIATLVWGADRHDKLNALAHIILRRTTFADDSESQDCGLHLEEEAKRRRTTLFLHSWAIPLREKCTMLSELDRREYDFLLLETRMMKPHCMGRLRLHYRDALVPLLLKDHPLQSLLFSRSPLRSGAINLLSRVEDPEDIVEEGCNSEYGEDMCVCKGDNHFHAKRKVEYSTTGLQTTTWT